VTQNFMQIPLRGASRQRGKVYAKNFLYMYILYIFFSETHLQVRPFGRFLRAMARTTRFCERMCLLGLKKFAINI